MNGPGALEAVLDRQLIALAKPALENGEAVSGEFPILNTDRSCGTMLSNEISKIYNDQGLPKPMQVKFTGSAGQSFGCFLAKGVEFTVEGDANDYWGKGLSGGQIVVYPYRNSSLVAKDNIIVGNVCFYGATSGKAFIRGMAGERFCVRNSGAEVVVEGIGDHGCEYMTGGKVAILGKTGRNFGAGMSGGIAYVLDEKGTFSGLCNMEMILLEKLEEAEEIADLKSMITTHSEKTDSAVAKRLLADWDNSVKKFVKVIPGDYKKMMDLIKQVRATGKYKTEDEIVEAAFQML